MSNQITTAMVDAGVAQLNRYLTGQIEPVSGLAVSLIYSAMLQASGGVSGEDGELIAGLIRRLNTEANAWDGDDTVTGRKIIEMLHDAAQSLRSLIAERDGLKEKQAGYEAQPWHKHMRETNAALADAIGLLITAQTVATDLLRLSMREEFTDEHMQETFDRVGQSGGTSAYVADLNAAVRTLLAKHGPSP